MTLLLISSYAKIQKEKKIVIINKIFREISNCLKREGYNVSHEQCNFKFQKNASFSVQKEFEKKGKTRGRPITWRYFDLMHAILHSKPEIQPPAVASSLQGYMKPVISQDEADNEERRSD